MVRPGTIIGGLVFRSLRTVLDMSDFGVYRTEARFYQPAGANWFAGKWFSGCDSISGVDGQPIDAVSTLQDRKRCGNIPNAACHRPDMPVTIEHFRPVASVWKYGHGWP